MSRKNPISVEAQVEQALAEAETLTIKDIVSITGLSQVYIRKALKAGKLESTKVPVKPGSQTMRNEITKTSFEAWRATVGTHSGREDGRNKFVLYMNPDEQAILEKFANESGFTGIYSRANVKPAVEPEA